ncbi:MFS transporter [Rhodococcoides yunnanense]|uniref:MFS transporter n=1 Tax=Rhodococcoides yunnanense TaxID=278209 RepID=UPI0009327C72|nr:MFS transporter [Rhodococcus yunnanensis]
MTSRTAPAISDQHEAITRQQWKWTSLAGMASYLDAGAIVALGSGLALFKSEMGLSNTVVGLLAAIGPNAVGCAIGAFVGGRLGDKLGRKRIYKWDLLVYAAAIIVIALAVHPAMLFAGAFVVGLAVGADVPTSLALVGEYAPARGRGKLLGLTQVAWKLGPIIVLLLALALSPFGLLGIRIVFLHLAVVALITWALRRGMSESVRWKEASSNVKVDRNFSALFRGNNLKALAYTGAIYLFMGLAAGTNGTFTPYIVRTIGATSQATSVALSCGGFVIGIFAVVLLFMRFSDRSFMARRTMWGVGATLQVLAYVSFLVLPFTIPTVILHLSLLAIGTATAGEATYKVFSQELFPTMLRGTAQGFTFGIARTALGIWSFFVPALASAGIEPVAWLLAGFVAVGGLIGFVFMPDTVGKPLEQIEAERA